MAGYDSVIVGGDSNKVYAPYSIIGGGQQNCICNTSQQSTIGGGTYNRILQTNRNATIGGGESNLISGSCGYGNTISGGTGNRICGNTSECTQRNTIGGGSLNYIIGPRCATISGGSNNRISGSGACHSFIGGGRDNGICTTTGLSGYAASIVGGWQNKAGGFMSSIIGGCNNFSNNNYTVVAGGFYNTASAILSGVLGGECNTVSHARSFIVGANLTSSAACTTFMNSGSFDGFVNVVGDVTANDFITTSDRDLKSNIQEIENGLNTIKQFTAYEYEKAGRQDAGFIAQEISEAIPYAVFTGSDGYLTMTDRPVLAHMHNAIIELAKRIKDIEDKLN